MEQYLTHTDYALWEVIVNGDAPAAIASVNCGVEPTVPPKTTAEKIARRNELKAKSTLLLAISDEHLLECQEFISQLEIHGEVISQEYVNLKLLRSLPPAWNTHTLIIRNKSDLDTLSMDDLYNNLKVYEAEIKGQSSSSLSYQNVALVYSDNTSTTNKAINTAHDVSAASLQGQTVSSTYADDVMFSFFANQSNSPHLDNQYLEKIYTDDLEEMDLKWRVAMLTMRAKRFIKKTGRNLNFSGKETVGFDKIKVECYNCHRRGSSSSNTEVNTCSKDCLKSYHTLQKQYDQQREILNKANLEIIAYKLGLESLESIILVHQKNGAVFEEDVAFLKYDVKVRDNSITELKTKLENEVFESASDSSVNESEEYNNQANDRYKAGEGYHAVPPPYTGNFMPPKPNMSFAGLVDSVFKSPIRKYMLNNEGKAIGQREVRPVWNNAKRVNHQNFSNNLTHPQPRRNFVLAVITNSRKVPVNAAKQSSPRVASSTSTARNVNTTANRPTMNGKMLLSPQHAVFGDQQEMLLIISPKTVDHTFDSGCSRHMTGNKSFLTDYQEIDGGFVAFGGSPKGGLHNKMVLLGVAERKNKTLIEAARTIVSPFDLEAYSDRDYTRASLDKKSTTGGCQFLGKRLISWKCKNQTIVANSTTEAEYVAIASCCRQVLWIQNQMLDYGFNLMNTKIYIDIENLTFWLLALGYLISEGVFDKVKIVNDDVRIQALVDGKKVVVNEASIRHDLRLDDAEGTACLPNEATDVPHTEPQAEERVPIPSHDPLPSGEDRLQLNELMDICTKLSDRVLSLEQTKTNQAAEIEKLKKRVKKLEGKKKKRTHGLKRLYKGRINDQDLFGVHDLDSDEVFVDVTTTKNTLMENKAAKPKAKGVTDLTDFDACG
nr:ribonuclease H-like domain-containing protein [Tanacetum cinerariifolium]